MMGSLLGGFLGIFHSLARMQLIARCSGGHFIATFLKGEKWCPLDRRPTMPTLGTRTHEGFPSFVLRKAKTDGSGTLGLNSFDILLSDPGRVTSTGDRSGGYSMTNLGNREFVASPILVLSTHHDTSKRLARRNQEKSYSFSQSCPNSVKSPAKANLETTAYRVTISSAGKTELFSL